MKYGLCFLFLSVIPLSMAWSANEQTIKQWSENEPEGVTCVRTDRNIDGKADYLLRYSEDGNKIYEEQDFNYDGSMDDFYFYKEGILTLREVDSNYDGLVDLRVYLHKGVYIEKYERDTDFDGKFDLVKQF
ncbi:MAG: hypothetical protein E4H36_06115 [Spirochaetales bacterium]|nr:MAG: hypothetical protein E4H36_06115 [Spirochaetales bacterium]